MKLNQRLEKKKKGVLQKYNSQQKEKSLNSKSPPREFNGFLDTDLLEKMSQFQLAITREQLDQLTRGAVSYNDVADTFISEHKIKVDPDTKEWIRFCLTGLWKKWFPDRPSIERVHELIYQIAMSPEKERCKLSLEAWSMIMRLMELKGIGTVIEYNKQCNQMNYDFLEWLEQVAMDLWNDGPNDDKALSRRLQFCQDVLARLPEKDEDYDLVIENFHLSLGETLFSLRRNEEGNRLFSKLLEADPTWGGAWVGWSDGFSLMSRNETKSDLERSEQILLEGLKVEEVRDRDFLLERLADVYEMMERYEDAQAIMKQIKQEPAPNMMASGTVRSAFPIFDSHHECHSCNKPATKDAGKTGSEKIGPDKSCHCGSGKKYKNCCGH